MKAGPRNGKSWANRLFLLLPDKIRVAASMVPASPWRAASVWADGFTRSPLIARLHQDHKYAVGDAPAQRVPLLADGHMDRPIERRPLRDLDHRLGHNAPFSQ